MTHTNTHKHTHQIRLDSSVRGIGPTQRPLPHNTQHLQETEIHAYGGIRTRNPKKRATADPLVNRAATVTDLDYLFEFFSIFHPTVICDFRF